MTSTTTLTNEASKSQNEEKKSTVSFRKGYWFYFEDGENKIAAHGSCYSGREEVFVNDKLVSEKRSFNVASEHKFRIDGENFRLKFEMENIFTGDLHCLLYKNHKLIARENRAYYQDVSFKKALTTFLACFAVGAAVGVAFALAAKFFYGI